MAGRSNGHFLKSHEQHQSPFPKPPYCFIARNVFLCLLRRDTVILNCVCLLVCSSVHLSVRPSTWRHLVETKGPVCRRRKEGASYCPIMLFYLPFAESGYSGPASTENSSWTQGGQTLLCVVLQIKWGVFLTPKTWPHGIKSTSLLVVGTFGADPIAF